MILWFPKSRDDNEDLSLYVYSCKAAMSIFKMMLKNNINMPQMQRIEKILKNKDLLNFTNKDRFSIQSVIQCYISSLACFYDAESNRCYYEISKLLSCPNTTNNLQFVIRLIEFGNENIPPTNWIRHSYMKFCELYGGGKQ